jgi:hypothetical protein
MTEKNQIVNFMVVNHLLAILQTFYGTRHAVRDNDGRHRYGGTGCLLRRTDSIEHREEKIAAA